MSDAAENIYKVEYVVNKQRVPLSHRFKKRQQARTYCRNHYNERPHQGMFIVHPDFTREEFIPPYLNKQ